MRILSMGEAMVELSGAGEGLWRTGFAGDTFNTAWYLAALKPGWQVDYFTAVGHDALSGALVDAIAAAGVGTRFILRHPTRSVGLYMIALKDGERSFSYWRGESAARTLADDEAALDAAFAAVDVIFFSGITIAILPPQGRANLFAALKRARAAGKRVVFDPNQRPRLWESPQALRETTTIAAAHSDICLPSFDDEATQFGDASPEETALRYAKAGAAEVVVKNGEGPLALFHEGALAQAPAPVSVRPVDTTGAGDSFNAGYLSARLGGAGPVEAIRAGQALAARVIMHPGALMPREALAKFSAGEPA